jgi:NDP-sugar pyrophosphorylase family protein
MGWCPSSAYWRDIGSLAAYRAAQMDLLDERVKTPLPPAGERRAQIWIGRGLTLHPRAHLEGPTVLGDDVQVAESAHIGPRAVVGAGCHIGAGARVEGAVLWERVEVGPGAVLRDCVVGADVRIGAHASLESGVVLESGAVIAEHARLPR